ncbi:Pentatricopeptide repeat-containing protein [Thalictrum thalictroides]|uniref:Pentatricopeptide repeat-containing protein n=1 Tax=Thalictrum thalictroides TaxID=46969 RepID=A0A7J6UZL0_THATH|nr:Pentatricopeptide repeat-containing protein [Thalictrum thalictroides]
MRNQWRLLLLRNFSISSFQNSATNLQVLKVNRNYSHLTSFLNRNVHENAFNSVIRNQWIRSFSSEPALELNNKEIDQVALTDILSKASNNDQIKKGLETIDISISHDEVLNVLQNLDGNPEIAWKFFTFVLETEKKILSSKSYNLMLGILGRKDFVQQFWDLVEIMKKKGYGVSKGAYSKASINFEKEGLVNDLDKLKELRAKPDENSIERVCFRVCELIRENDWDEDIQKKLKDLNCSWSNDLVAMTIEHLSVHPTKALMFFWWVEENPSFKHNGVSYNAMLKVLGREDCTDKFWRIVNEMKEAGFQMDMEVYNFVMERFYKRKIVKDAVDLYEFMMGSSVKKPSVQDSLFLMRKIVVSKNLDMELFSKVVKLFTDGGNSLTESILYSVVKSLISVNRLQECGKILKAMEEVGFVPTKEVYDRIIFHLGSVQRSAEALQFITEMEASGCNPDSRTWCSLIHGQCVARDLKNASSSFRNMLEKVGVTNAGYAFEVLMSGFCRMKKAEDACKFFTEMVDETEFRPHRTTYKMVIEKLLVVGSFNEALSLIRLMKGNGYPPYLDPFIDYISKIGSGADAMRFFNAITDKKFPSTSVFIRLFEAFFKAGRQNEAQNCLSKCPTYIRSHADVLNLFCAQKPVDLESSAVVA